MKVSESAPITDLPENTTEALPQITVGFPEEEIPLFHKVADDAKKNKRRLAAQVRFVLEQHYGLSA
jgi:hypothetical protein